MKKILVYISLLVVFASCSESKNKVSVDNQTNSKYHTGDIIFQTSLSSQSKAIQLATKSKYSHVGIIYFKDNKTWVLEAVQPVKVTPLDTWINRGKDKHFVVKRLKSKKDGLGNAETSKIESAGRKLLDKDYDLAFEWSNEKIYCSELVWKVYKKAFDIELSPLKVLKDFDIENKEVNKKLKERYGDDIPLDEKVVSPSDLFDSELLYTVISQ